MTDDQTVTQALLPCPFCGGEAEEATSKGPTGERYRWAQCTDCGAMSECCDDSARHNNPDEPEPIDLWNTRTAHSGEGRSNGAGEDVERLVRIFRSLPLHGDAGCDKLTDDEWRQVALAALTDISLSAPQGEVERLARNVRGWLKWRGLATADDDNEYLNGKGWDDAEALASTSMGLLAALAQPEGAKSD